MKCQICNTDCRQFNGDDVFAQQQRRDALEPFAQPLSSHHQEFFGQGVLLLVIHIHERCRSSNFSGFVDRKQLGAEIRLCYDDALSNAGYTLT